MRDIFQTSSGLVSERGMSQHSGTLCFSFLPGLITAFFMLGMWEERRIIKETGKKKKKKVRGWGAASA